MELIDDWRNRRSTPHQPGHGGPAAPAMPVSPEAIEKELIGFQPEILSVHCYEDLRYPWVHVVFGDEEVIAPEVALRLGDALAAVAGPDKVYLNSLHPRSVYFVLATPFEPQPSLPATRYGTPISEIKSAWRRPNGKASSASTRKSRSR